MIKKINNFKLKIQDQKVLKWQKKDFNKGMTYVELIVVLGIFSLMTSVVIFNYNKFQDKVDIQNTASDIALKLVEAQKTALSGKLPPRTFSDDWKPSYGVYFNSSTAVDTDSISFNKKFVYFANLDDQEKVYDPSICPGVLNTDDECLDKILITKGSSISSPDGLKIIGTGCPTDPVSDLNIVFDRPNSGPSINSTGLAISCEISYAIIKISSSSGTTSCIKVYPSGRMETGQCS